MKRKHLSFEFTFSRTINTTSFIIFESVCGTGNGVDGFILFPLFFWICLCHFNWKQLILSLLGH